MHIFGLFSPFVDFLKIYVSRVFAFDIDLKWLPVFINAVSL